MSFLSDQKDEIMRQDCKNQCCKKAFFCGMLYTKSEIDGVLIRLSLDNDKTAEYTKEIASLFSSEDVTVSTAVTGGRRRILSFSSKSLSKYLSSLNEGGEAFFDKCASCSQSFLRGVFFACGRVSDPKKQYRLEFSPTKRVEALKELLSCFNLSFSVAEQKKKKVLYTGRSTTIEDFFVEAGMNNTAFEFMNSKIEGELKNSVNRIRNCETNNIGKSVSASVRQSEIIEALESANLISMLPEELEKTARMRLRYRDYSLSRLAAEFSPPISKPGLSHRLNKIVDMAESLLNKK